MTRRGDEKPCRRCGVPVFWSARSIVPGICRDCRQTDPAYVQAIRTGVPIDTTRVPRRVREKQPVEVWLRRAGVAP